MHNFATYGYKFKDKGETKLMSTKDKNKQNDTNYPVKKFSKKQQTLLRMNV